MMKRPQPGEDEDDLIRMQEEFLKEKAKDVNFQPSAAVTNLRRLEPTKRGNSSSDPGTKKPSKYAQAKGLKGSEKRPRIQVATSSVMGDIFEKNIDEPEAPLEPEDDKVYFPKIIPSLLGDIVEKNTNSYVDLNFSLPSQGFPAVTKRDPNLISANKNKLHKNQNKSTPMDTNEPSSSSTISHSNKINIPTKSYIISSNEASNIHDENIKVLSKMSEKEIFEERQKLISSLDPKLIEFLKNKRNVALCSATHESSVSTVQPMDVTEDSGTEMEINQNVTNDFLWENDILSHPQVHKWLHFNSLEKDKLEWMKGIEESKKINPDELYEARFDLKGYLLPYTMEYTEKTKTLYHHGDDPHRPGYTLMELFELSRSTIIQQRVMALNTLAGIAEYNSAGTYKDIVEIPLSKIFFVIRIALDENKVIILEPALKAMRNILCNRVDEACLDALLGFEEGTQQPCLENDKSEIDELESKESEFIDYHLAEIDLISAALRTEIIQRLYYILDIVKPSFNCVQYALQVLTRLARDSIETALKIVNAEHLMKTVICNFIPTTSINFLFEPQIVYNGKPVLAAVKLLRILTLQSREIGDILISKHDILKPVSEYVSSGVDGTYGLRIQIEAFCVLSNLLHFSIGGDNALALAPIITTTLYKHVKGTDVYISSSVISITHAAVVLQYINKCLNCRFLNLESWKHQMYPLLKEGVQKWLGQLSLSENYTCGHLRLICSALDCCKTVLISEELPIKFLNDSLKSFYKSKGFKEIIKNVIPCSNLLSNIEPSNLFLTKNLMTLGGSVIDSSQKVLPLLTVSSPLPFLASLFNLLVVANEKELSNIFLDNVTPYFEKLSTSTPSLCDNWYTRIETDFVYASVQLAVQSHIEEHNKDLLYLVANKLCYILRIDKRRQLEYVFSNVVFNKQWFTAERLLNLVSISEADSFSKVVSSIDEIRSCYSKVFNLNYRDTGPNIVVKKWQEPILPRDWIYLPILTLYSKHQEVEAAPRVFGEHAKKIASHQAAVKEMIIICSLEWILFNELCFPDLLNDIDVTDRFCRLMCVFLCDSALFLEAKIKILLHKCIQILFKKKKAFDFDKDLVGLHNFQDFYTQFLEQFQSVSYGDPSFAACVLVPLAQKHNVKWRKLLWSEYAGCLRALDCPEDMLCYEIKDYFYPEETDESLLKSYFQALSSDLLRPNTIAHKIASHHVKTFKMRSN